MSNARNLARLIVDSGGDVDVSSLGNVPPSNDASALTTGTLPVGRLSSGVVIQTQVATLNSSFSTSSGTWAGTGLSIAITPKSASSTLIAIAHIPIGNSYGSYNGNSYGIRLNGVAGPNYKGNGDFQLTTGSGGFVTHLMRWDSVGTSSTQTYDVAIAMSGGVSVTLRGGAQLIVMEVA